MYRCDPIRNVSAGLAIVDAAYGSQETTVPDAEETIITIVKDLLSTHASVLMPVPKHGRGLDMICLLSSKLPDVPLYADATQLTELHADPLGFWTVPFEASPQVYRGTIDPGSFAEKPQPFPPGEMASLAVRSHCKLPSSHGGISCYGLFWFTYHNTGPPWDPFPLLFPVANKVDI